MKRIISTGLTTLLSIASAQAGELYASYTNVRYGYSITYPITHLVPQPEADNGDGRAFNAKTGKTQFLVYAGYNALGDTPGAIADKAADSCPAHHAEYRIAKPTLVAISCETTTDIIYQKTIIRNDLLITMRATYPMSERAKWDPIVLWMARSLTPVKLNYRPRGKKTTETPR